MGVSRVDVVVVGGGIAGVSAASQVAASHSVVLLEQESELAYHTTSRSAAVYIENEGGPVFHRLSHASRPFFDSSRRSDQPLVTSMPVLSVGDDSMAADLEAEVAEASTVTPSIRFIEGAELLELCPALNPEVVTAGMFEDTAGSIDVMAVHQVFLRTAREFGAEVWRSAKLTSAIRHSGSWHIETAAGAIEAKILVNAAGAWGDVVASRSRVQPVGLTPKRRTAFTSPVRTDPSEWPFIYSGIAGLECYFKPESGNQLLCSLADEGPSEPCDAKPEEIDIALAIDRINTVSNVGLRSVATTWAGLRTFAPDRNPVFGWDDQVDDFLWMVGQGGCGIVTSPIAGEIAGALVRGETLPVAVRELGLTAESLAPRR
ncbi:MAG: D-arginine dehydrogenase [Verrucomicrobiales bacterium]|jgi:D-arginine dehydrogenase